MSSINKSSKFLSLFFPIVLVLGVLFISFKNYTPETYLIGWDSMHPEFNFSLNAKRMLSHVWGGEMGLGAISAHSDMSDLPRVLTLWLVSVLIPSSFIRYFSIFFSLILGPLGIYFLLKYVFQREKVTLWIYPASFLGGLFYLLNLGTLQNFYVPLEMFTIAFAGLPWLTLAAFKYLREGKAGNLLFFSLVSVLISPMAYAATQAYAVYFGLFLFLLSFAVFSSDKKLKLKRFLSLGIVALLLNIYWIMPSVYSVVQQSLTISNANINRLFSQESFLRNADYGHIKDILIQKSFLFSWRNFDFPNGVFKDLLGVWNIHLSDFSVMVTGYGLALIAVLGLFVGLLKREKAILSFALPLMMCLFFLFNINPPLGQVYRYLYDHFGIFSEGFRTPFTKFSVLFELIFSFYFGYFCFWLLTLRVRPLKGITLLLKTLFVILATSSLFYFSLPVFKGGLIGSNVRVSLPGEYQELFSWFEKNPEGRVALMPINTKYGWDYRSWGYEGSGFLTYGIPNPLLYRDFDRWNSANEDFYTQSSFALYANGDRAFAATLKKYQVKYLLLDESMTNAGGSDAVLKIPEIKAIAEKFGWGEVAKFGFLTVYDTGFNNEMFTIPEEYSQVAVDLSYSLVDPIYLGNGDYVAGGGLKYPFIGLDKRSGVEISLENGNVKFRSASFDVSFELPATGSAHADLSINQGFDKAYNCDLRSLGSVSKEITASGVLYKASGGGVSCDYISFPDLNYSQAYVLHVTGENHEGRGLKIYLFDSVTGQPYIEETLPVGNFDETYFIYPREIEGQGYTLNFETRSFGRMSSENILTGVEFVPVDYSKLSEFSVGSGSMPVKIQNNLKILEVKKYGDLVYKVKAEGEGLLELNQGYEKGWVAFTAKSNKFKTFDHIKVNSWANGWVINDQWLMNNGQAINHQPLTFYVLYWPQFLEWGGLLVGALTLLILVLKRH
ncbi:hypothetical protein A2434_01540 [Candidatus Woesebacteria bacterium RIFOXYC1_FULL_41_14]|uniref:Membrane protein 6-pyruvoyl-tetrahydropterin synthase-related domain-containing protein n=5 Tax=Candidatus Woeseibacteriota TaxID=1752722 RepID=A0A0G0UWT8_9BACT|nr:MAG: hypothetical protein UT93_C0031G0004 [Candidatus Woesebacteria bacterium GW2011_GWF1_40_24]OGM81818.1 MAG: hypothetical protein A2393_00430 [Candidatus Woesebacteria bacterium RIFOXYB1_FULL_41_13]OGM83436.1 MAG: hypothetical protein A2434_01540 [Candidatus Woesebacteria bacterium RIFOXYC1_FULL_41_14]OGM87305.1 MAG: hypothetical protein A2594_01330 [Candidatus Woesebacteria bacterium RIFOXYD1_FULL_41_28]